MDMTQPRPAQRLFSQVGCSQCGQQFKALRDSGFSACGDHLHFHAMEDATVSMTSSQVAAMDDTMTALIQRPAPYVSPKAAFDVMQQALARQFAPVSPAARAEGILRAFRQPATGVLNHAQLTSILERVLTLFEAATEEHQDCDFRPVTDALEAATLALDNVRSCWADAK